MPFLLNILVLKGGQPRYKGQTDWSQTCPLLIDFTAITLPLQHTDPVKVHATGMNMEVVCKAISNTEKKLQIQLSEQNEKLEKLMLLLSHDQKKPTKYLSVNSTRSRTYST